MVRCLRSPVWGLTEVWEDSSARQPAAEKTRFALTQSINFFGPEARTISTFRSPLDLFAHGNPSITFIRAGTRWQCTDFCTGDRSVSLTVAIHNRCSPSWDPHRSFFRAGSLDYVNNPSPHAQGLSTHRSVHLQFARLHGSSNGSASREIRIFGRATAYERHFRCRAQAQLGKFLL